MMLPRAFRLICHQQAANAHVHVALCTVLELRRTFGCTITDYCDNNPPTLFLSAGVRHCLCSALPA